jgi:DNA processing protein
MEEIEAFAVLSTIPYLGAQKIRFLLQTFGSAAQALQTPNHQLEQLPGFDRILPHWSKWPHNPVWKQDLALVEKLGAQLVPFTSPQFPKSLLHIPDAPALLYMQGQLKPQDQRAIAVIGTRQASIYGNEMAEKISRDLAKNGFTVISGLARGIDTSAHRGALEQGRTIAVIGSGLADVYPAENQKLAKEITQKGVLISEFGMSTPPDRQNFPQRNRIVSGMSLGTLLIEAPLKSGAMITMGKAHLQKKPLFVLPGRADTDNFRGNHELIKRGQARLVENAADVIQHFDALFPLPPKEISTPSYQNLDKNEKAILDQMSQEEIHIDTLAELSNLPIHQVQTAIMGLLIKKIVKEFPGKIYKKV